MCITKGDRVKIREAVGETWIEPHPDLIGECGTIIDCGSVTGPRDYLIKLDNGHFVMGCNAILEKIENEL